MKLSFMKVSEDHKREVERQIIEVILEGLHDKKITVDDLPEVARFVLSTIHKVETHEKLGEHIDNLITQWPLFEHPRLLPHRRKR